jgi:hypothetical protein
MSTQHIPYDTVCQADYLHVNSTYSLWYGMSGRLFTCQLYIVPLIRYVRQIIYMSTLHSPFDTVCQVDYLHVNSTYSIWYGMSGRLCTCQLYIVPLIRYVRQIIYMSTLHISYDTVCQADYLHLNSTYSLWCGMSGRLFKCQLYIVPLIRYVRQIIYMSTLHIPFDMVCQADYLHVDYIFPLIRYVRQIIYMSTLHIPFDTVCQADYLHVNST